MSSSSGVDSRKSLSRRLLDLSLEDKRKFINSFDYVLTDCDGVVWNMYGLIEGAGGTIGALKDAGKRVVYVSNNSVRTLENYKEQVGKLGHELNENDLVHPAISVIRHLKSINFAGLIYAICAEPFIKMLRDAGYEVITGPHEPQPETLRVIIPTIRDNKPVKAVIVDYDFNCNHVKLLRAEMYLKSDPNCLLIAGATDYRVSITPQFSVIGAGYYAEILERAAGRKAIVLGKPGQPLADQLRSRFGIEQASRVLFVGDMINQDVAFGRLAGFQTLLVLTGGCSRADVDSLREGDHVPDFYTDSFANLGEMMREVAEENGKSSL